MMKAFALLLVLATMAVAEKLSEGLIDPVTQPLFRVVVPNPLDPSFIYDTSSGEIDVSVARGVAETGLVAPDGSPLLTNIVGYGTRKLGFTWPGRTFEAKSWETLIVRWHNEIEVEPGYLLVGKDNSYLGSPDFDFSRTSVVDTTIHWAYSLPGYEQYTIEENGTPIVPHLHGGHNDVPFDGNAEFFFGPKLESGQVQGPQYVGNKYIYDNSQAAATLW
jgi:spore coat protein A, manganese oxidase